MAFANLSISRVDGIAPVRPRIAERAAERTAERARPESTPSTRSAERTKLRTSQSEEGSLTLTTAEGDKLTISFSNQQSTRVDQARLYGPNGSFEATRTQTKESSQLSVSLKGDLSEAELKDITDLISKLSSGLESAPKQVASTNNLGSIQNYSFAYRQSSDYSLQAARLSVTA